ncbi:MAG TPA: hypothetical protein VKR27_03780, partial [Acidimicrobiales bacterium]|nr:hypothetical protein [Acidimicrobiales bacterium]
MPAATEPADLTSEINAHVSTFSHRRHLRRRLLAYAGVTAVGLAAFTLYPTISAQATLSRIAGALDGVDQLVARRYTLDGKGRRTLSGVQAYDHGRWRIEKSGGKNVILFTNGRRYRYDPYTNSYVVEEADGPFTYNSGIRLSSILKQMSIWHNSVRLRSTMFDGKTAIEATITSQELPERTIVYADAKNSLPIKAFDDALENGVWRRTSEMDFDYGVATNSTLFVPDPRLPELSRDEWEHKVVGTMLKDTVAEYPLHKGELVVRALDVATDGSVFVAFQSGQVRSGWTGYGLTLTDDLGTVYTQIDAGDHESPFDNVSRKEGGRIEFTAFIPT